jgi:hypothetical protein
MRFFYWSNFLPLSSQTFTYSIPAEYHYIKKGMRLAVPLKNVIYTALCKSIKKTNPHYTMPKKFINTWWKSHCYWGPDCPLAMDCIPLYVCTLYARGMGCQALYYWKVKRLFLKKNRCFRWWKHTLSDDEFWYSRPYSSSRRLRFSDNVLLNKKKYFSGHSKLIDKKHTGAGGRDAEIINLNPVRCLSTAIWFHQGLEVSANKTKGNFNVFSKRLTKKPHCKKKLVGLPVPRKGNRKGLNWEEIFEDYHTQRGSR